MMAISNETTPHFSLSLSKQLPGAFTVAGTAREGEIKRDVQLDEKPKPFEVSAEKAVQEQLDQGLAERKLNTLPLLFPAPGGSKAGCGAVTMRNSTSTDRVACTNPKSFATEAGSNTYSQVASTTKRGVHPPALVGGMVAGGPDSQVDDPIDIELAGIAPAPQSLARQPEQVQIGAFAVPGPEYEDALTQDSLADPQDDDPIVQDDDPIVQDDDPIAAELIDADKERQLIQEQVQKSLQRERSKAPVAHVVEERFCHRRRTMIVMLVLALLAILGIVLGVTLSEAKGPPPAPVPPKEEIIEKLSFVSFDGGEAMQAPESPQNRALNWLANDTFQGYHTEDKLIQRYALATVFYSTDGNNWKNNSLWLDNGDECGRWWQFIGGGITCNSTTGGITNLGIGKNNLKGTIPPEIGLLPSLVELDLSENDLRGTMPSQIGELTSLESLVLKKSKLFGSILENIADLTMLKHLNLAENELTGTFVAADIGKLTRLEEVFLEDNRLTGTLSDDISKLTKLRYLNLRGNLLSGPIPSSIGRLTLLTEVQFYENMFSGTIPSQIGLLSALIELNLRNNNLTGTLPSDIVNMSLLKSINLRENQLTGTIPSLITELTNLGKKIDTTAS